MTPLKLLFLFAVIHLFYVSRFEGKGMKTFQLQWPNGSAELFTYENSENNNCIYDDIRDILICTGNHPYDVVTSRWRHKPDDIKYVSVNCLSQTQNTSEWQTCLCKNKTLAPNLTRELQNDYYLCQLDLLYVNIFNHLTSVETIDLSHNKIHKIDSGSFDTCSALQYLALNDNPLSNYPPRMLCGLSRLHFLDISYQDLTYFPSNIFTCDQDSPSSILVLNISHCLIHKIVDDSLRNLQNLISLDLRGNGIHTISDNGLRGASSLVYFDLSNNSLDRLPSSMCNHLTKLKYLFLQRNRFKFINMTNVIGCSNIETIDLSHNSLQNLDLLDRLQILEGQQSSMTSLRTLNLGHNNLTEIRDTKFLNDLGAISELDFSWNQISLISDTSFDGVKTILKLDLSHNKLTGRSDFHRVFLNLNLLKFLNLTSNSLVADLGLAFEGLSSLVELDLSYNNLQNLTDTSFSGLSSVKHLKISHNHLQHIHKHSFMSMSQLESLDISHNKLISASIYWPGIKMFDVSENRLGTVPDGLSYTVVRLLLNGNRITSLRRTDLRGLIMLQELDLSRNRLTHIEDASFASSYNITSLNMSFNDLHLNFTNVFRGLPNIETLILNHNNINSIDGMFKHALASLKNLDISFNKIRQIKEPLNPTGISENLHTLNLEVCEIKSIVVDAFVNLTFLQSVNLQRNKLTHVPLFEARTGTLFLLKENPIVCSCDMTWLTERWVDRGSNKMSSFDYDVEICTVYPQRWVSPIRTLSEEQFLCEVTSPCPQNCSCYSPKENGSAVITVCNKGFLKIPTDISNTSRTIYLDGNQFGDLGTIVPFAKQMLVTKLFLNKSNVQGIGSNFFENMFYLEEVELSDNSIKVLSADIFHGSPNLKIVRLHQNQIRYLPRNLFKNFKYLKIFDISANRLHYLLPHILQELDNIEYFHWIHLASNPWNCDCSNLALRKWLETSYSRVYDRRHLFCNGEEILRVPMEEFYCAPALSPAVMIGLICLVVVIFILGVVFCIAYYRKTLIPVFYTRFGLKCLKKKPVLTSTTTLYDIVVIVHDKDHKCVWWVINHLVPKLTVEKWKFRIHVPAPNDEAGEITNSTLFKMEQSNATLIVVSKHFQDSYWCVQCSRHAYDLVLLKQHTVVLITWGEMIINNLDPNIRAQIQKGDNISIREHFLWDKLIYKLPPPNPNAKSSVCRFGNHGNSIEHITEYENWMF